MFFLRPWLRIAFLGTLEGQEKDAHFDNMDY